ncbi:MAG: hypothetical protein Q9159_006560 [Coniocarpon cinnabarinum]
MPFHPPAWTPKLPKDPPDTISIPDFILNDETRFVPLHKSRNFVTCGLSGKTYSPYQVKERVELLARGLLKELGWSVNQGTEWDKVVGVFAVNTIETPLIGWACHKINAVNTPANAAYATYELEHQLRDSGAKCVFTCAPLLETTLTVTRKLGIADSHVFIIDFAGAAKVPSHKSVDDLVQQGKSAPSLEPLRWSKGQGARQTAFLCYSSGTSGLPKGVMISHRNVISNSMQLNMFDGECRDRKYGPGYQQNVLGLLPFSHIYGLVVAIHASINLGDGVIVLPKFEMQSFLNAIQTYEIGNLFLVPPIIINMVNSKDTLAKYDLSAVREIFTGAAPLGAETAEALNKMYPSWLIKQGYGLTETATVVCSTPAHDIFPGSSGSLLPSVEARLVTVEGNEITGYDQPGELWAKSPSVVLGYLNNEKANGETFVDGYMRTGDEAVVRKNPATGNEHIFIVDRIKELIKVKGLQVAPAELEAHLLSHKAVSDCAVIPTADAQAGERPKAYVVKSSRSGGIEDSERLLKRDIMKHVEREKARHKWIKEIEFVDAIPKSPSGKILRRLLRDKDREQKRREGARL